MARNGARGTYGLPIITEFSLKRPYSDNRLSIGTDEMIKQRAMFSAVAMAGAAVAMAMASTPARADVKSGVDAWSRGEYKKAVENWRPMAIAGDADAQFNLAQAYKLGPLIWGWQRNGIARRRSRDIPKPKMLMA